MSPSPTVEGRRSSNDKSDSEGCGTVEGVSILVPDPPHPTLSVRTL